VRLVVVGCPKLGWNHSFLTGFYVTMTVTVLLLVVHNFPSLYVRVVVVGVAAGGGRGLVLGRRGRVRGGGLGGRGGGVGGGVVGVGGAGGRLDLAHHGTVHGRGGFANFVTWRLNFR